MVQPRKPGDKQIIDYLIHDSHLWDHTHNVLDWAKDSPARERLAFFAAVEYQREPLLKPLLAKVDRATSQEGLSMALARRETMPPQILNPLISAARSIPLPMDIPAAARLLRWAEFPKAAEVATDFLTGLRGHSDYLRKNIRTSIAEIATVGKEGLAASSILNVADGVRHGLGSGLALELLAATVIAGSTAVGMAIGVAEEITREGKVKRLTRLLHP